MVEENASYSSVIENSVMPYLNSLASSGGLATQYFADTHPSIGNYFMLTTGHTITNDDNFSGIVSDDNLVRHLIATGKTWKSYAESLPSVGYTGPDAFPYLKHHNPCAYFSDVVQNSQANNLVPFSQFGNDLANNQLPDFSFIVPNAQNDAHDCPVGVANCTGTQKLAAADAWLQSNISPLISSAGFQQDGLLLIVFDEADLTDFQHGGGHVARVIVGPKTRKGSSVHRLFSTRECTQDGRTIFGTIRVPRKCCQRHRFIGVFLAAVPDRIASAGIVPIPGFPGLLYSAQIPLPSPYTTPALR